MSECDEDRSTLLHTGPSLHTTNILQQIIYHGTCLQTYQNINKSDYFELCFDDVLDTSQQSVIVLLVQSGNSIEDQVVSLVVVKIIEFLLDRLKNHLCDLHSLIKTINC